ncbi:hypothetical protein SKPI104516_11725 [Skermania piniformis]
MDESGIDPTPLLGDGAQTRLFEMADHLDRLAARVSA